VGDCVLAIDQGTSGSTVLVVDSAGQVVGRGYREITQHYPEPGWVEHDPEEIWHKTLEAVADARAAAGPDVRLIALGITNQRETTILWDAATGSPVHPAIVWQDRRTAPLCESLRAAGLAEWFTARTGLVIDAYFSGTKIQWLLHNIPDLRGRAAAGTLRFGTVDSWLVWKLTNGAVHATDYSNASRTLLLNLDSLDWDPEILQTLRIPPSLLPRIVSSSGVVAETAGSGPVPAGLPIASLAGDQQAALFGQSCFLPGMAKNTYGTGSFVLLHTGGQPVSSQNLLATVAYQVGEQVSYALEGSIFATGAAVQWLRDGLGIIESAADSETLAAGVDSSDGVYVVPAFVGLGAPHWDQYARGTIIGITRGTTRAHIARATLESIAFQTRDVVEAMEQESGVAMPELRVDGGAARNDLLMQIQADILGRPVVRAAVLETTALGAAYLAGLGVGVWSGTDELARLWRADRTFEPRMPEEEREALYDGWKRALERAKGWARN